jgi:single-strand DNA-binding protein
MASVNKVILIGNLGRDPELRFVQSGQAVANFTLATNDRWTDREGKPQERTEWHRIVVWGKQAENCANYLAKGRSVYVEGRLQTREWEDKEGQKRQTTEVVAQLVQFLDRAGREGRARAVARTVERPTSPGGRGRHSVLTGQAEARSLRSPGALRASALQLMRHRSGARFPLSRAVRARAR